MRFKLNECYFTTYKAAFNEFYDCDFFRIDLITQKDRECRKNNEACNRFAFVYRVGLRMNRMN